MAMNPSVLYTPCATYLRKKTGKITTFSQFEEWNLLSETRDYEESGDKSDDNSIMPPLISKEVMDAINSGDDYDDETISTKMLEDIFDGIKYHPSINTQNVQSFRK